MLLRSVSRAHLQRGCRFGGSKLRSEGQIQKSLQTPANIVFMCQKHASDMTAKIGISVLWPNNWRDFSLKRSKDKRENSGFVTIDISAPHLFLANDWDCSNIDRSYFLRAYLGNPLYSLQARARGTIWQIGVLSRKLPIFSRFERFLGSPSTANGQASYAMNSTRKTLMEASRQVEL